jgi:hypothetical protein
MFSACNKHNMWTVESLHNPLFFFFHVFAWLSIWAWTQSLNNSCIICVHDARCFDMFIKYTEKNIEQIYHVWDGYLHWEGYLRKIPILRLNFTRLSAPKNVRLSIGIFRKYPSQTWYICSIFFSVYLINISKQVFIVYFRNVLTCYKPFEEFWFLLSFILFHAYIGTNTSVFQIWLTTLPYV